jgi:hypothetical protein
LSKKHVSVYGVEIECGMEKFGSCSICNLIDPDSPSFNEAYAKQFSLRATPEVREEEVIAPSYPSRVNQAWGFARSFLKFAASGFSSATMEEQEERLAICMECEMYDATQARCMKCGCYLAPKVTWTTERCPLEPPKWGAIVRPPLHEAPKGGCGACGKAKEA